MAVEHGVQGSAKRHAPRAVRHRPGKRDAGGGQPVEVESHGIRVAHVTLRLPAVQVAVDPDDVGAAPTHRSTSSRGLPYEQANLVYWYLHQEAKQRCHHRLARWIAQTGDAFELPDIDLKGAAGCWPSR